MALDHPAVIKTYDFGNTSNGAFMLLELFKVPNLKQQIISGGYKKLRHRAKPILAKACDHGDITVVAAIYDIDSGKVAVLD